MTKAEEEALKAYPECVVYNDLAMEYEDINGCYRVGFEVGYNQAKQDLWHNVKDETPIDGERLLLINRNGEYGTTMLMMPILYKEFRNWEKWAYIKDLIPSE